MKYRIKVETLNNGEQRHTPEVRHKWYQTYQSIIEEKDGMIWDTNSAVQSGNTIEEAERVIEKHKQYQHEKIGRQVKYFYTVKR